MSALKLLPIGGIGNVTKNMYLYEYQEQILIVDCGIGFPTQNMLGVDVLIPDISYLKGREHQLVGMILTHAHDDHIAALPYILPDLPPDLPIYGSKLTIGFAADRLKDSKIKKEFIEFPEETGLEIGPFQVESVRVPHSVPDTRHYAIHTPEGTIYHGSDYKFDLNPVDGITPDFQKMSRIGQNGVLCLLSDCLRSENKRYSLSESILTDTFEREIRGVEGKFIITSMSSNVHRIQQAIDVAIRHHRKIAFIGRSVEQNIKTAVKLSFFNLPEKSVINKRRIKDTPPNKLCVIIAGSQGQPESSLARAALGDHTLITIEPQDKVVFSSEPIPGNEDNVYNAIDNISKIGAEVVYSDVHDNLHVSGHASAPEQQILLEMTKPKYAIPIGGTYRHMVRYRQLAQSIGYKQNQIALLQTEETVEFEGGTMRKGQKIPLKHIMVDGNGIGDVGTVVLSDRKAMADSGMVAIVIPVDDQGQLTGKIEVISRGFVFMKHAGQIILDIEQLTAESFTKNHSLFNEPLQLRKKIEKEISDFIFKQTGRNPLVLSVLQQN